MMNHACMVYFFKVKSSNIVKDIGGKRELSEADQEDGPPAKRKQRCVHVYISRLPHQKPSCIYIYISIVYQRLAKATRKEGLGMPACLPLV